MPQNCCFLDFLEIYDNVSTSNFLRNDVLLKYDSLLSHGSNCPEIVHRSIFQHNSTTVA